MTEISNISTEIENTLIKIKKYGINKERLININKISLIEELIKCSICNEIVYKPFECENCGSLFCEECINDWIKVNKKCPSETCNNLKVTKAKINEKKLLNLIQLKCINYPDCSYTAEYWDMLEHENKCTYQKIKCPNFPCNYEGHFLNLKNHLTNECNYIFYECGFCKCKIYKNLFQNHLEEHYNDKSFYILNCRFCGSSENLRKCICKKVICLRCLNAGKNYECKNTCYLFQNDNRYTSQIYNISKYILPKNCEIKLLFDSVDWIRSGISFSKEIVNEQNDFNCPSYDIYCILEDLIQFYSQNSGWKNCFNKSQRPLKSGDYMTITFKNRELRYAINNNDLGSVIKIDMTKKKDAYLFIQARNPKSKAEIIYICEILN